MEILEQVIVNDDDNVLVIGDGKLALLIVHVLCKVQIVENRRQ